MDRKPFLGAGKWVGLAAVCLGILGAPGRVAAQAITEFPVLTLDSQPSGITAGPDGNLWFTEAAGNRIGRITPAGVITEVPVLTPASQPVGIPVGPDGNLGFTEFAANKIGRIPPSGVMTEFPAVLTPSSQPFGIVTGSDARLWFTESAGNRIGRTTGFSSIEFIVP